jgi:F-type H+/Na+-transporting ATPase subunit alpha
MSWGFSQELSIMADAGILDRLARRVEDYRFTLRLGEQGRVESVGDGICWVHGLPTAAVEEILHFAGGSRGLVFELQAERLGVILLGRETQEAQVASGTPVSHSGERLEIGVGNALLGRVVDPLGKPLDGLPPLKRTAIARWKGRRRQLSRAISSTVRCTPASRWWIR